MTKTEIATRQCAKDYAIHYPFVIRMDDNSHYCPKTNWNGYPCISFRRRKLNIAQKVEVHRIIGFQKYGDAIFDKGINVRHLDGNKLNFSIENIGIGTVADNMHDKNPDIVKRCVIVAATANRVLTNDQVDRLRADRISGLTFRQLAVKYGLSNKGHAHWVYNRIFVTNK